MQNDVRAYIQSVQKLLFTMCKYRIRSVISNMSRNREFVFFYTTVFNQVALYRSKHYFFFTTNTLISLVSLEISYRYDLMATTVMK